MPSAYDKICNHNNSGDSKGPYGTRAMYPWLACSSTMCSSITDYGITAGEAGERCLNAP